MVVGDGFGRCRQGDADIAVAGRNIRAFGRAICAIRHPRHRRRHQWLRHRARRGRARLVRLPLRKKRSRIRNLQRLDEAHPWRPALSRIFSFSPRARSAARARGARGASRRTSSGRCASSCRTTGACVRPGCCGSAFSSTIISAVAALLPATRTLDLGTHAAGAPLKPEYTRGFEYSDCWVEDSRLVVLNARDAADGAR